VPHQAAHTKTVTAGAKAQRGVNRPFPAVVEPYFAEGRSRA